MTVWGVTSDGCRMDPAGFLLASEHCGVLFDQETLI